MRSMIVAGLMAFITSAPQVQATTVVADFNEIPMAASASTNLGPNGWTVDLIPRYSYEENGFQFSTAWSPTKYAMQIGAIVDTNPYFWTGTQGLFHSWGGSAEYTNSFEITRVNGEVFDLISLDIAALGNGSRYFMVYGYPAAGGYVQQYFPLLDNSFNTLETLTFGDTFRNLKSVSFSAWGQQIDNVTFGISAPVPEAETYAMYLAGLGLLGVISRRKKMV